MGLFTALTGSIAFAVYAVVAGVLEGLKKYRYIYGLLLVVLPFWLFPGLFLLLPLGTLFLTPLFGNVYDRIGKGATLMIIGSVPNENPLITILSFRI